MTTHQTLLGHIFQLTDQLNAQDVRKKVVECLPLQSFKRKLGALRLNSESLKEFGFSLSSDPVQQRYFRARASLLAAYAAWLLDDLDKCEDLIERCEAETEKLNLPV
ncbi:MAG: hypothetical protein D6685_07400 [Bacteroidetes bacterium]|nr:hypothetical protein AWN76_001975 [Rhodothermaceae bacterium RA]RMH63783.1 MAG: hypothetical protein D6685_07400 [Bacteroidota bacterium]